MGLGLNKYLKAERENKQLHSYRKITRCTYSRLIFTAFLYGDKLEEHGPWYQHIHRVLFFRPQVDSNKPFSCAVKWRINRNIAQVFLLQFGCVEFRRTYDAMIKKKQEDISISTTFPPSGARVFKTRQDKKNYFITLVQWTTRSLSFFYRSVEPDARRRETGETFLFGKRENPLSMVSVVYHFAL